MSDAGKSLVAGYLKKLAKKIGSEKFTGSFAYRGQANSEWKVESAAFRRLENNDRKPHDTDEFITYLQKDILEPARMRGHGVKNGRELSDLELLAELQHHGAATCLIDFTREFFVALWFACQPHKGGDGKECDGQVIIMNTNDPRIFRSLESKDLVHSIERILKFETRARENTSNSYSSHEGLMAITKEKMGFPFYWHWSPHGLNERITSQRSLFVFGKQSVRDKHLKKIPIEHKYKKGVLDELASLGITNESLFKDLPGFASIHRHNQTLSPNSAEDYLRAGHGARQKGEPEKAERLYTKALEIKPNYVDALSYRGHAKLLQRDYEGAVADYDESIKLESDNLTVYQMRALAHSHLGNMDKTLIDIAVMKALWFDALRAKS